MDNLNKSREAFAEAIDFAGSQVAFAMLVSTKHRLVSQQVVSCWFRKGKLPAEFVLRVERLTGVPREALRPDVFLLPEDMKAA